MSETFLLPTWVVQAPVARLATVDGTQPHLVPVVFCVGDGQLFIPIDGKRKSGAPLKRVRNIEHNPAVSLLVDAYSNDWSRLRWTRIDGRAGLVSTDPAIRAALEAKYPQYEHVEIGARAIRITIEHVASWSATEQP
ncbi:MAG: TIGR03668 family PPOX class F420-dependent oxidoreductase [Gammaproteobacteria bacterium]|nr:TIGR03668 family PPOX class F420-dependent oxidoreductase [Gammaproteobacteria bacterium]